ncbi:acetate/propionate family kinase [Chitinimonas sp. JJ19]|uniref:acetate/propionate family kinase n=1 Tax=Chitinimonas sp. JJ19 TaxID=3109352 RepID=UPI002FFEF51F
MSALLALNAGSSSIKFALFDLAETPLAMPPLWQGQVSGLHGPQPRYQDGLADHPLPVEQASAIQSALQHILAQLPRHLGAQALAGVVHRVVHGGDRYVTPTRLDRSTLAALRSLIPLAPLHQPHALEAIEHCQGMLPGTPQLACFDTAFHHTLPEVEQLLPLPPELRQQGIRRYGFHGLSYQYLAQVLPQRHGDTAQGRLLCAHLGSGASLCAMQAGQSVATTMGFSALDGLMMGSRSGSMDPGVLLHLLDTAHYSPAQLADLLYRRSGLLGMSGLSADTRVLLQQEADHPGARQALALYVRRIVRECGALVAVMGGLDMLAFTAGVGERSAEIRRRICDGLAWLGISLDDSANNAHAPLISSPDSRIKVVVEPTQEEWMAATAARALL